MATTALVLLCGSPGSGKTTLVATLQRLSVQLTPDVSVVVLSVDDLQRIASFDAADWHAAREKVVDAAQHALEGWTNGRRLVVVDDTMFYRSMRRRFFLLATELRCAFRILYVQCPVEICLDRNAQRDDPIPQPVLRRADAVFEPPDEMKAYWEHDTVTFDSARLDPRNASDCEAFAWRLLTNWEAAKKRGVDDAERQQRRIDGAEANLQALHQLDLRTRSLISQTMRRLQATKAKAELQFLAKRFNLLRSQYLASFKSPLMRRHNEAEVDLEAAVERFDVAISVEAERRIHIL